MFFFFFFCQGLTASHGDILVQGSLTEQKEHARFYRSTAWWSNRATLLVLQPLQMLQICPLLSMPDNGKTPNMWSCPGIIIIRHSVRWISGALNEHYLMFWALNRALSAEKTRDAQSTKSRFTSTKLSTLFGGRLNKTWLVSSRSCMALNRSTSFLKL